MQVRSIVLVTLVAAMAVASFCPNAFAQGWDSALKDISTTYYRPGGQRTAIDQFEGSLDALGQMTNAQLDKILPILKDYFTKTSENSRFQAMVLKMFAGGNVDKIVGYFKGTKLFSAANSAKNTWTRPASASIRLDAEAMDVGEGVGFSVSVTNQAKVRLSNPDVSVTLVPPGFARFQGGKIVGEKSGKVKLLVTDPDGTELASRDIEILGGQALTISPDYKEIEKGKTQDFTVESNKPLDKFPIEIFIEPQGALLGQEMPGAPDASHKVVRVTAKKEGTAFLRVAGASGAELARATIFVPPKAPSILYPAIGAGVTVVAGIWAFTTQSAANDKFDEHQAAAQAGNTVESEKLFAEYDDKNSTARIGWIVTGVAAVGTGYLVYKYLQDKKAYEATMNDAAKPISFNVNPASQEVALTIRF